MDYSYFNQFSNGWAIISAEELNDLDINSILVNLNTGKFFQIETITPMTDVNTDRPSRLMTYKYYADSRGSLAKTNKQLLTEYKIVLVANLYERIVPISTYERSVRINLSILKGLESKIKPVKP